MIEGQFRRKPSPFNSTVEVGMRALCVLAEAYPRRLSLRRLTIIDYLMVHSDDVADGPPSLHPRTPLRGGELLVRRGVLRDGILLYQSRGLAIEAFTEEGLKYGATDNAASFLAGLTGPYLKALRERGAWALDRFGAMSDAEAEALVSENVRVWGAEHDLVSILALETEEPGA